MVLHALDLVHEHSCMSSPRSFFGFGDWAPVTDTTGGALYEAAQCVEEEERSWYQHYYSDNCNGEQIPEIRRRALQNVAFKVAAAPFHMWTPDVYEGAPSSTTGLMAVAVKTAAFGALARLVLTCFDVDILRDGPMGWETLVAVLAVLSMFGGNLMALGQTNLKRMLAYSAIAHTGYMLVALVAQPEQGLSGGLLFYLLAYTLANAAAFGVAAALSGKNREDISDGSYQGLARKHPGLAFILTLAMLSLLGIPATAGFIGKFGVFSDAVGADGGDHLWLVIVAMVNSVISAYYYIRVIVVAYMREEDEPAQVIRSGALSWSLGIATLGTLVLGLLPNASLKMGDEAGQSLTRSAKTRHVKAEAPAKPASPIKVSGQAAPRVAKQP